MIDIENISGCQDAGGCGGDFRNSMATLSRHVSVQQFRKTVRKDDFHGSLVSYVRQNVCLHQQVNHQHIIRSLNAKRNQLSQPVKIHSFNVPIGIVEFLRQYPQSQMNTCCIRFNSRSLFA